MVQLISTITAAIIAVIIILAGILLKNKKLFLSNFTKISAAILALVTFARYIYDQPPVYYIVKLAINPDEPDAIQGQLGDMASSQLSVLFMTLMVWFIYTAMFALLFSFFFKYKALDNIAVYFALPVYLISIIFFERYATGALGINLYSLSTYRIWYIAIEGGLGIGLGALKLAERIRNLELNVSDVTVKSTLYQIYVTIGALLVTMPCFIPQALLGFVDPNIKLYDITEEHRFMIYFSIILPIIIFQLLKNKPQDVKRFAMIFGTLGLLWVYLGRWDLNELLTQPLSWPLHLCNTAMFIVPLCLIFKMNKLYNFCLFINVLGSMMAMVIPGELIGTNAMGTARVSFWINHYTAFAAPLLLVALKVFKRPKFKEWVYSVIALTVYFASVLFINAWFSNYGECDYFFINSDFIVSGLGKWAENTMDYAVSFTIEEPMFTMFGVFESKPLTFTFYPIYQALFYVTYIGFSVGMWFLYTLLFALWDKAEDRRLRERDFKQMKKDLRALLGGRNIDEPLNGDSSPKISINHFCKRYGSNKHYSVNDVSYTVNGGEIFGFLGPNGAGKSTIIKSMVGIQTITSGSIEICGYDVENQPVQAKLNMGFVPDHYALYENLTGREYINYIADLYQVSQEVRDERIEKYVTLFQLVGSFDNQMKTYSHGMKQKIAIMSALVHNPKVWILDEPLTGLDPTSIHEVKECMKEHAANGNIVFFSSHIIDVVEKICDRIAIIKKGKLRAVTSIEDLSKNGIELEQFYLNIINTPDEEPPATEEIPADKEAATV